VSGFPPFKRIVLATYCAACRIEMPPERWASHYRTKGHRENIVHDRASALVRETARDIIRRYKPALEGLILGQPEQPR
jgi:hypothetical protein